MSTVLFCDIGGTNSRLILYSPSLSIIIYQDKYPTHNFPNFESLFQYFFSFVPKSSAPLHPTFAMLAIAAPVVGNQARSANIKWDLIDGDQIAKNLNISKVHLLNDLEAISLGVLSLQSHDLLLLNPHDPEIGSSSSIPPPSPVSGDTPQRSSIDKPHLIRPSALHPQPKIDSPILVICPGTGFGSAFLTPNGKGSFLVWGSEAGHSMFGAGNQRQTNFANFLRKKYQLEAVWTEKMISGSAIPDIHEFVRESEGIVEKRGRGREEKPKIVETGEYCESLAQKKNAIITEEGESDKEEKKRDIGKEIFRRGLGREEVYEETVRMFIELMGTETGNLGIRMLPYGGIYLVGGIMKSIAEFVWETREDCFLVMDCLVF
jgi:glucokinase